jgi:hypothetical protein
MRKHAHSLLLSNNVDVVWPIDLLKSFNSKSWEQTDNRHNTEDCPECAFSVHLRSCFVEELGGYERTVDTGPEKDEQVTNDANQQHDPIPSVCVDQDVRVDGENGGMGDVGSKSDPVLDVESVECDEGTASEQQVRNEEDHD